MLGDVKNLSCLQTLRDYYSSTIFYSVATCIVTLGLALNSKMSLNNNL